MYLYTLIIVGPTLPSLYSSTTLLFLYSFIIVDPALPSLYHSITLLFLFYLINNHAQLAQLVAPSASTCLIILSLLVMDNLIAFGRNVFLNMASSFVSYASCTQHMATNLLPHWCTLKH
ncbi:hypothetical protein DFH05DRAFT_998763 [Lentinula detonsa]|uniref:Uncharacterized protein n=1 Tax=Lentinula detonsa TaxID=2804962 RepID=A0A9W8TY66_9AGAR|nr:hypothetical protein DFH05DRAFT_998763 [Lentinula detonsa]